MYKQKNNLYKKSGKLFNEKSYFKKLYFFYIGLNLKSWPLKIGRYSYNKYLKNL